LRRMGGGFRRWPGTRTTVGPELIREVEVPEAPSRLQHWESAMEWPL
jgi:hypothetical protein